MKKILSTALSLLLIALVMLSLASCLGGSKESLWDSATYKENTAVGEGSLQFTVEIEAEDKTVSLTVNTNEANLGAALYALGIVNDPSFFDTVIGIKADWNKNRAYWAFYQGDTYMSVGIDAVTLSGGEQIRLVYATM